MIPLIIIMCIVALIAFLLSIKITLKIRYTESLTVYLKILFIKIKLHPKENKKKKYPHSMSKRKAQKIREELENKRKKKKKKKAKTGEKEKEKTDFFTIISIVFSFVKNFIKLFARAIRVKASRLKVTVASEDAAQTALTYTAITQSINLFFPLLDNLKTVKKLPKGNELEVNIDFLSDTPTLDIDFELYVRIGGILKAVCGAAINAFKKAVKDQIKKLEKTK